MAKSVAVARLKVALSEYLAKVKAGGLIRVGSGRLPQGFWKLPRPGPTRGAGVKAIIDERRDAR